MSCGWANIHISQGYPGFIRNKISGKPTQASCGYSYMVLSIVPLNADNAVPPKSQRYMWLTKKLPQPTGYLPVMLKTAHAVTVTAHQENHPHRHPQLTSTSANQNQCELTT